MQVKKKRDQLIVLKKVGQIHITIVSLLFVYTEAWLLRIHRIEAFLTPSNGSRSNTRYQTLPLTSVANEKWGGRGVTKETVSVPIFSLGPPPPFRSGTLYSNPVPTPTLRKSCVAKSSGLTL